MSGLRFSANSAELHLISRIADRAVVPLPSSLKAEARRNIMMDLNACHSNGCPIDFGRLLTADEFNFWHDISGISRHLNRQTGKLENLFSPRFALKEVK